MTLVRSVVEKRLNILLNASVHEEILLGFCMSMEIKV